MHGRDKGDSTGANSALALLDARMLPGSIALPPAWPHAVVITPRRSAPSPISIHANDRLRPCCCAVRLSLSRASRVAANRLARSRVSKAAKVFHPSFRVDPHALVVAFLPLSIAAKIPWLITGGRVRLKTSIERAHAKTSSRKHRETFDTDHRFMSPWLSASSFRAEGGSRAAFCNERSCVLGTWQSAAARVVATTATSGEVGR